MKKALGYLATCGLIFVACRSENAAEKSPPTIPQTADVSVMGIELLNPESAEAVLGAEIKYYQNDSIYYTQYYNSTGDELLTALAESGDRKNSFREFQITKLDKKFNTHREVRDDVPAFRTGKQVALGMTKGEAIKILGEPAEKESAEIGEIFRYVVDDTGSSFLKRYKNKKYYGEYAFQNDALFEIRFGFK